MYKFQKISALVLFFGWWLVGSQQVSAETTKILTPASPNITASSYILMDYHSGRILAENNSDESLPPASLTKIMTVYVVFNTIKEGHLNLSDKVSVSKKAWKTPGSRMFIEVNKQVSVEELLKGVIIQSGNDASVALAEHIAGDEGTFAVLMNEHAQRLGMTSTHFENSMGLPSENHRTTARDLALLTRALILEFPEHYHWHSQKEFTYNKITQHNRNKLLWRDATVDGVKTGHTNEAGYCLVASAKRDGMRLISVVMGTSSENARADSNQTLLNFGFHFYQTHLLYKGKTSLKKTRVWKGEHNQLNLGLVDDLYITIARGHYKDLKATIDIDKAITAPVSAGDSFGKLHISLGDQAVASQSLIALESVSTGSVFQRIFDEALLLME